MEVVAPSAPVVPAQSVTLPNAPISAHAATLATSMILTNRIIVLALPFFGGTVSELRVTAQ
jgi:hypothetical protein